MYTTFNDHNGSIMYLRHESARDIEPEPNSGIVNVLFWAETNPYEWRSNGGWIKPDLLSKAPTAKCSELSAVFEREDKRKKNKRKRKKNRKMKKLRICPICNINNKEYKFYKCKGCRRATYCSRSCQKKHWKMFHKLNCVDC